MQKFNLGDKVSCHGIVGTGILLTEGIASGQCLVWWLQYGVCHEKIGYLVLESSVCIEELLVHQNEGVRKLGTKLANEQKIKGTL